MTKLMLKLVTAQYSVPSWLWVIVSICAGFLVLLDISLGYGAIHDFVLSLPLEGYMWGPVVIIAGFATLYGFAYRRYQFVRIGAFFSFFMWLWAVLIFFESNDLIGLTLGIPMILFWAYKYFASYVRQRRSELEKL